MAQVLSVDGALVLQQYDSAELQPSLHPRGRVRVCACMHLPGWLPLGAWRRPLWDQQMCKSRRLCWTKGGFVFPYALTSVPQLLAWPRCDPESATRVRTRPGTLGKRRTDDPKVELLKNWMKLPSVRFFFYIPLHFVSDLWRDEDLREEFDLDAFLCSKREMRR